MIQFTMDCNLHEELIDFSTLSLIAQPNSSRHIGKELNFLKRKF